MIIVVSTTVTTVTIRGMAAASGLKIKIAFRFQGVRFKVSWEFRDFEAFRAPGFSA